MATLYNVYHQKSNKSQKTLMMTDIKKKCQNYVKAREVQVRGVHTIELAEKGQDQYKRNKGLKKGAFICSNGCYTPPT